MQNTNISYRIPYHGSIDYHPSERAQQAAGEICGRTKLETQALKTLTNEECPSTPKLIAWKHETQDRNGLQFSSRDCLKCGFVNLDKAARNLIWDEGNAQWYVT